MRKKRRSIALPEPMQELLQQEADRLGITVAELLRIIIHQHFEGRES